MLDGKKVDFLMKPDPEEARKVHYKHCCSYNYILHFLWSIHNYMFSANVQKS